MSDITIPEFRAALLKIKKDIREVAHFASDESKRGLAQHLYALTYDLDHITDLYLSPEEAVNG